VSEGCIDTWDLKSVRILNAERDQAQAPTCQNHKLITEWHASCANAR